MATSFTAKVWQNWPSTATLFAAPDANRWEQAFADLYRQVTALTGQTDPSREFAPENFGAAGDGVTIDRGAVQAAIDAANIRYTSTGVRQTVPLTGLYLLDTVDYHRADGTVNGAVSLMLKDGVTLAGSGTLKVKNGAYGSGAFYAAIRSASTGLSNAGLRDITIDGNKAGQTASTQCSNVVLEAKTDIDVTAVRSINANGNGIMVRGTTTQIAQNVRIRGCYVTAASMIGIQVSHFDGLDIDNNAVTFCGNNSIDVYGESGTTTTSSNNYRISNNRLRGGLVNLFLESVGSGVLTGNQSYAATESDIHVNRINSQPHHINIVGNLLLGSPRALYVTGDTGGVTFRDNTVVGASIACVQLGGGGGNVSYVYILNNTLDTANRNATPLVLITGNQAAFNRVRGTVTQNTDRTWDTVVTATTVVGNAVSPANAA